MLPSEPVYCVVCKSVNHDPNLHLDWRRQRSTMPLFRKKSQEHYNARGRAMNLGSLDVRDVDPSPVLGVGIGSAGLNRLVGWLKRSREYGCDQRIAAMFGYDLNSSNMRAWLPAMQSAGMDAKVVTPEFMPYSDGFLRQPNAFMKQFSSIEADSERMIMELERIVARSGSRAQLIVEFLGFGGHARLGFILHQMLADAFPDATLLPVVCLPSEPALMRNIRDFDLWHEMLETFPEESPLLLTDNAMGETARIDNLAIELLAAAELTALQNVSTRRLPEIVSGYAQNGQKYLSVSQTLIQYPANTASGRQLRAARFSSARRTHDNMAERSAMAEAAQHLSDSVWRLSEPGPQSQQVTCHVAYDEQDTMQEQGIIISLPFDAETVHIIEEQVIDLLRRDEHSAAFPNTFVSFCSGHAGAQATDGYLEARLSKLYGSDDTTPSAVDDILNDRPRAAEVAGRAMTRGQARLRRRSAEPRRRMMPAERRQDSGAK